MDLLIQISLAVICIFIVWRIYKTITNNPQLFSKESISKSFFTMGVLGLILLGGIAILVVLLRLS
jgi:hypothetical protein